jgi:hypothetical protein
VVINTLRSRVNGGPESARISAVGCSTIFVDRHPKPRPPVVVPFDVIPIPDSITTARLRDTTLAVATHPTNPDTRFIAFFPPPIPPPQFLQVPRTQVNYEPKARTTGCRQRTWDTS